MPNGGSDCCATCCFNSKNEGKTGYHGARLEGEVTCVIRELHIPYPFSTYCANHPRHNKNHIQVPLGPVFESDAYPYTRKVWLHPPDTEIIRLQLLELLHAIEDEKEIKYFSSTDIEEIIINQLVLLKDKRAIEGLRRIVIMDVYKHAERENVLYRNKLIVIAQAIEGLLELTEGDDLDLVSHFIQLGLPENPEYDEGNDPFSVIRYHLVRGLKFCSQEKVKSLLAIAMKDPNTDICTFANEIYKEKGFGK